LKVKIAFASGSAELNRATIDRFATAEPQLPLLVVSEFEPHVGEWIPYHVRRSFGTNRAAIRAALAGREIAVAAVVFTEGRALAKLRLMAFSLSPLSLVTYGTPASLKVPQGATRWLRRVLHPSEAEIPVRARLAQLYGVVSSRIRAHSHERSAAVSPLPSGVSVVIPSRDGRDLLAGMLPLLLPQIAQGEIIVVDNGSSDGTADWLTLEYPSIEVIRTELPLSFARAVNAGIVAARFCHTLLLNNDMLMESNFVAALQNAFTRVPDLFCATAQIFFPPGIRREETGKAVWRRDDPLDFPLRCDDPIPSEDLTPVLYGSGGCSLYDTAKLRGIGGVAEIYEPAYVEDMDLGYRAWKRGWPSVFCADARVEHRHRATTSRFYTPRQLDFFVERNYLRFLAHAVGSPALFRRLWMEAIRRLQLVATNGSEVALDALRKIPAIGPKPAEPVGHLTETEILALGNGDVACFPGHEAAESVRTVAIASPYLPYPLSHGGAVRIFNLMTQASARFNLVLVAFCDVLDTPPKELLDLCCEVVLVRRHGSHYRADTEMPDVVTEFESECFRACLKQTVARWKPATVQLEFTWMAQYANACAPARTVLVEHDITFDLQRQLLETTGATGVARWELEQQLAKWIRFERDAWKQVDCVVTMSKKDAVQVSGAHSVVTLPNGVDCERFQPYSVEPVHRRLLFIGSFAHLPNLLALEFFVRDVWPLLQPGYTLHVIAGLGHDYFPDFHRGRVSIDLNQAGIEVEGFVPDVREAYSKAELVLAPLTASAGTNIKVLEAMAMGRAVVTTAAGMNGLDLKPGVDIVLVDTAVHMAAAIEALSGDRARRIEIERQARQTAPGFDWRKIGREQARLYSL
jgi:GT2 family glycosyltransferase/glycosyltransferase involved in cell wall biosynthesis